MMNMNPIDMARQRAEQSRGGSATEFFSLKEGESTILRFLSGMVPTYLVSHQCGLHMVDIPKDRFEDAAASGSHVICPGCGMPLSETDIVGMRAGVVCADVHNFFPTSEADKRTNFTCLGSPLNARYGYVPANGAGEPLYQCPACACQYNRNKDTGKPKMPTMRVYGAAVEREAITATEMVNGIPTPVVKEIRDVMVETDGVLHPKVVLVNMGFNNFWSKLSNWSPDYSRCICNHDWRITRLGAGLQTSYDIQCLNNDAPTSLDPSLYEPFMPDIDAIIKGMGTPQFYVKKGYAVAGFNPEPAEQQSAASSAQAAVTAAAFAQRAMGAQPVPAQQPQVGYGNDWSVVQNQFR